MIRTTAAFLVDTMPDTTMHVTICVAIAGIPTAMILGFMSQDGSYPIITVGDGDGDIILDTTTPITDTITHTMAIATPG